MDGRKRSLNMSAIVISDNCFGNYDDNDNNDREPARRAPAG